MEPLARSVMVGVTGRGENTDALRYALAEARTSGVGIALVHAIHPILAPPGAAGPVLDRDERSFAIGCSVLEEVRQELEELAGGHVGVTTTARHGEPGPVLAELSQRASRLVLQHRDLSRLHRVVTGSTVAAAATHAHVPVVSVPSGERTDRAPGVVTVALRADGGPPEVLEAAFAEAAAHGSRLRVLHAERLAPTYDDLLGTDWMGEARESLHAATEALRDKAPEVTVDVSVLHEWPADALVTAAADSELLVVGRHAGRHPLPPRLGALPRTAIRAARCPVMVVPV